jgi:hypothetical protein
MTCALLSFSFSFGSLGQKVLILSLAIVLKGIKFLGFPGKGEKARILVIECPKSGFGAIFGR